MTRSLRSSSSCKPPQLIQGSAWLTRELPFSIASFPTQRPAVIGHTGRKRALRRRKLCDYRQLWVKRIWLWVSASFGGIRSTTQLLRSLRSPRRLLPITPRSTLTLVASIADRDGGANRWQASNAPCPSILATEAVLFSPATITFSCVTGLRLPPITIARWRSRRISCVPRSALPTLKYFVTAIPLPPEKFWKTFPPPVIATKRW